MFSPLCNPRTYDDLRVFIQWPDGVELKHPVLVLFNPDDIEVIECKTQVPIWTS